MGKVMGEAIAKGMSALSANQTQVTETLKEYLGSLAKGHQRTLAGIKFEQSIPILRDTSANFDKHWNEFQNILDCHCHGKDKVRPYDTLIIYRKAIKEGSTRLRIFDTMMARARKLQRLPDDAAAVLEEITAVAK